MIHAFDAGQKLGGDLSQRAADISVLRRDMMRVVDLLNTCRAALRERLLSRLEEEAGIEFATFNCLDRRRHISPKPDDRARQAAEQGPQTVATQPSWS